MTKDIRNYIVHKYLLHFYYTVFSTFGVLLLYEKTGSILFALFFLLTLYFFAVVLRSVLLKSLLTKASKYKTGHVLFLGAFLMFVADIGLVYLPFEKIGYVLLGVALVKSLGTSLYTVFSNSIEWSIIGNSNKPAKTASYFQILKVVVSLSVVLITMYLALNQYFIITLLVSGLCIFLSVYPLLKMELPTFQPFSFREVRRKISWLALLANYNIDHQFKVTALPLVMLVSFGNIEKPILVVSIVLVINGFVSYIAGKMKDKKQVWLIVVAAVLSFAVWFAYAFATTIVAFTVLGILLGVAHIVINNGRESNLGKDLIQTNQQVQVAYVVEFFRSLGQFTGVLLLVGLFFLTQKIPQIALLVVPLFMLPKICYALQSSK